MINHISQNENTKDDFSKTINMALFVEHISNLSADITSVIKCKVSEWIGSQASFIQALFGNVCWES